MTHKGPPEDLPLFWQKQKRALKAMTEEEIRDRANAFEARARRNLIVAFGLGIALLVLGAIAVVKIHYISARIVAAAMIILTAAITYRTHRRIWRPQTMSPELTMSACLEFYRKELKTQYRNFVLKWRLLVSVVFFLWLVWNSIFLRSRLVVRLVLPSALVLIFFVRRREAQKLKHELAALNTFEHEEAPSP